MGFFEDWDDAKDRLYLRGKVGTILGGVPSQEDFYPSIVLVVLYTTLFAPVFWRLYNKTLNFNQVWRPLIVIMSRIASFAIRIKLAEGKNWNKDLFVAELILLRLSPILLTSALLSLFRDAMVPYLPLPDSPSWRISLPLKYFISVLQMAVYFCLGLTIAIAFDVKQAINGDPEARVKLHRSKEISIYMLLAVNASIYLLSIMPCVMLARRHYNIDLVRSKEREVTKLTSLLAVCTFLLIVSGFKTAQLASAGMSNHIEIIINKKTLFYGICVTAEYIACALLATLAWNRIVAPIDSLACLCQDQRCPPQLGSECGQRVSTGRMDAAPCPTYIQQIGSSDTTRQSVMDGSSGAFNIGTPTFHSLTHFSFLTNKRCSAQTLSTISEVRRQSSPSGLEGRVQQLEDGNGGGRVGTWYQLPPASANESVKSHWSDDSEDDKKGSSSLFTLVKGTRDSLSRKGSKGSRTSSTKGDRTSR